MSDTDTDLDLAEPELEETAAEPTETPEGAPEAPGDWPEGVPPVPADYRPTGWDGEPVTDTRTLNMYWLRENGYTGAIDQDGNPVADVDAWLAERTGGGMRQETGTQQYLPEGRHGQTGGAGGGGKGVTKPRVSQGEPRRQRRVGGGGGGFTFFKFSLHFAPKIASGNQIGPKQIGRSGRPAPQRRTRRV